MVTAEEGSLSSAAKALKLTQPTLSRQVAALESALGVTLFERVGRGLALTDAGLALLDHVRSMGEAANHVAMIASGQSMRVEGLVSVSASHAVAAYLLPEILRELPGIAPGIRLDIVASNQLSDLKRREADIAIRHVRPEQPDLIGKLVRQSQGHLYAATAYLDRIGRPQSPDDLNDADFVGFDQTGRLVAFLNGRGFNITAKNLRFASENSVASWELVKAGLGIGVMASDIADKTAGVELILPEITVAVPLWLTTHRELRTSRPIRIVFDFLAARLAAM